MRLRVLAFVGTVFAALDAFGCGACTQALFDSFMPPVYLWLLVSVSWFISHGIIRGSTGATLPFQPKLLGSIGVAFLAFAAGAAMLGPVAWMPLAIPPLWAFVATIVRPTAIDPLARRAVLGIGIVHAIVILGGIVIMVNILRSRTDAEYITQWSGTAPSRGRFNELRAREPGSIATYRALVVSARSSRDVYRFVDSAERIAEIGDPAQDIPLLEQALERLKADVDTYNRERVQDAVKKLRAKQTPPVSETSSTPARRATPVGRAGG